jgi:hypothetical protein
MKKYSIGETCEKLGISWNGIGYKKRKHSIQIREWKNDKTITPPLKQTPPQNTTKSKTHIYDPIPHLLVNQTKFCYIFRSPKPLMRNQVKHLLIILISILLLSSPLIGDNHKGETFYECSSKI